MNSSDSKKKGVMMKGYNLEVLINMDDARRIDRLFWNPLDVCRLAWDELLKKLSAVGAFEEAVYQKQKTTVFDLVDDTEDEVGEKRPSSSSEASARKRVAKSPSPDYGDDSDDA